MSAARHFGSDERLTSDLVAKFFPYLVDPVGIIPKLRLVRRKFCIPVARAGTPPL
jgi:hypothetical protein